MFRPQKERSLYHKQAFYHLQHNDGNLYELHVGWPLPSLSALESVVEAIATNTTVYRLDIREGDTNLYPEEHKRMEDKWWYKKGQLTTNHITSGLLRNTSI